MGGDVPSNTTSTQTTVNQPPEYLQPYITAIADRASALSNRPFQAYPGEQLAPLNSYHYLGMDMARNRALNGSPGMTAANNQATNTLNGQYLGQGAFQANGMGVGNPYLAGIANQKGISNAQANNGWAYGLANQQATANGLAGVNNPYLNNVIQSTNSDIVRQFQNSQMPQTDASFARSGAFGGSAWQQANAENNRQMVNELIKNESNIRMRDYANQQQLAENYANRQQQADVNNRNMLANYYQGQQGLEENYANRQQQADANNRQAYLSDYMQRQQSAEDYAGRQQSAWNAERDRQVGAITPTQQLFNQPYTDAMQLLGLGDIDREFTQSADNVNYQNWLNWQNWPLQNLDILQNGIRSAMGGGGSSTQTATMPQINRTASMIGGGLAGMSLANSLANGSQNSGMYTAAGAGLGALSGYLGG